MSLCVCRCLSFSHKHKLSILLFRSKCSISEMCWTITIAEPYCCHFDCCHCTFGFAFAIVSDIRQWWNWYFIKRVVWQIENSLTFYNFTKWYSCCESPKAFAKNIFFFPQIFWRAIRINVNRIHTNRDACSSGIREFLFVYLMGASFVCVRNNQKQIFMELAFYLNSYKCWVFRASLTKCVNNICRFFQFGSFSSFLSILFDL